MPSPCLRTSRTRHCNKIQILSLDTASRLQPSPVLLIKTPQNYTPPTPSCMTPACAVIAPGTSPCGSFNHPSPYLFPDLNLSEESQGRFLHLFLKTLMAVIFFWTDNTFTGLKLQKTRRIYREKAPSHRCPPTPSSWLCSPEAATVPRSLTSPR